MSHVEYPEFWDNRWKNQSFGLQNDQALLFIAEEVLNGFNGKKILEVASGRGIDSLRMAQKGAEAHVVDFSNGALEVTQQIQSLVEVNIYKVQADAIRLPFSSNSFDLVFSQGLMEHLGDRYGFLREQVRVTRPGGYVLVDIPNKFSLQTPIREILVGLGRWPQGKEYPMSVWELKRFMNDAGLKPIKAYGWDLLPLLQFGLRDKLRGKRVSRIHDIQAAQLGSPPSPNFFTRNIEAKIGHLLFLNNVGFIGQKVH